MTLNDKQNALTTLLLKNKDALFIACSGGLDSRFLAYYAKYVGIENIQLLHIIGAHIDPSETIYLKKWALKNNFSLHCISVNILENTEVQNNVPLRCYYCKHKAFSTMLAYIKENFIPIIPDMQSFSAKGCSTQANHILKENQHCISKLKIALHDGTHFDDTRSHRPGLRALEELKIVSPLALCSMTKSDILNLAKHIGLENATQKAKPCLLTRFNYNTFITRQKLLFIAEAEKKVEAIFTNEFSKNQIPDFRIREVKTDSYEIHTTQILSNDLIETLQSNLKKVMINPIECRTLKTLSGFFDTKNKR